MVCEIFHMKRKYLEVRPVVTRRQQAKAFHLGRNEIRPLLVPDSTHLASLHRIVSELIEADLKITLGDGCRGRRAGHVFGIAVPIELPLCAGSRAGERENTERGVTSLRHSSSVVEWRRKVCAKDTQGAGGIVGANWP